MKMRSYNFCHTNTKNPGNNLGIFCLITGRPKLNGYASTQVVVSTTATRCDGNRTELRQCTEPEEQLAELYRLLKLKNPPIKRTLKICVVHSEEILKNDT